MPAEEDLHIYDLAQVWVRAYTGQMMLSEFLAAAFWHWEQRPTLWQRLLSRWCRWRGHRSEQWLTEAWIGRKFCRRCGQERNAL